MRVEAMEDAMQATSVASPYSIEHLLLPIRSLASREDATGPRQSKMLARSTTENATNPFKKWTV